MARHKDVNWRLNEVAGPDNSYSYDTIRSALLMDLRDELKKLNSVFACYNFLSIPTSLRTIARFTKPRRITAKQAARVLAARKRRKAK